MTNDSQTGRQSLIVSMSSGDLIGIFLLGGSIGLLGWALGALFNQYVFEAYLCQGDVVDRCYLAKDYSAVIAAIIASVAALAGLVRLRIYRPLLVLIASMIGLWGILQLSWSLPWYQGLAISIVIYALAFGTFSWVSRIRPFLISLAVILVLVIVLRLVIVS